MQIDSTTLTRFERQLRQNVRNYLYVATIPEMIGELRIALDRSDELRARFVRECIHQYDEFA